MVAAFRFLPDCACLATRAIRTFRTTHHGSPTLRNMTTAYSGTPSDGKAGIAEKLPWIPYQTSLPLLSPAIGAAAQQAPAQTQQRLRLVEVGPFQESEWGIGKDLMNLIILEGRSWPFEEEFETIDDYRSYFLSHTAFVVRALEDGVDSLGKHSPADSVMGCFYIKPNYPGRCSHVCNGGFITAPNFRRQGVAKLMGKVFLQAAKDLGYKSSYFNLVFKSNGPSVKLWESLGFDRVAVLEEAARLKGIEGLDTAYGYRFDLTSLPGNYLSEQQ
jgi:RimJ/RimL family protein N-acetyltransferase